MKLLILNGFDRSGTSYIGGLLAQHPEVNYFFQPFSSTEVHKTQFEVWGKGYSAPDSERFLRAIQNGVVDSEFITSDWFDRYSSYSFDVNRKVCLIKDTKLHAKIGWLKGAFPDTTVYGIWRDPRAILYSLLRNEFHIKWYGEPALKKTAEMIRAEPGLECFMEYIERPLSPEAQMALIIAARTRLMLLGLNHDEWLSYEHITVNPDSGLNNLCERLGMSEYDFSKLRDRDYNVTGLPYQHKDLWQSQLSKSVLSHVQPIFDSIQQHKVACHAAVMSKV